MLHSVSKKNANNNNSLRLTIKKHIFLLLGAL